jgi:hypothetical protein
VGLGLGAGEAAGAAACATTGSAPAGIALQTAIAPTINARDAIRIFKGFLF